MSKTVYVVGGDPRVEKMFEKRGWVPTSQNGLYLETYGPNLVCFTGGEDVSPSIYGEENKGSLGCNLSRDQEEVEVFNHYVSNGVPMVGICRGGQLLNVLNGGRMVQDLGRTISGDVPYWGLHKAVVRVDHHQGMLPGEKAGWIEDLENKIQYGIWYPESRSLCFQPHPEWGHKGTEDIFFDLLEEFCFERSEGGVG